MKYFFITFILLSILTPANAQLSDTDLDKIRLIVKGEIEKESTIINQKIDRLDTKIEQLDNRIQQVEKDVAFTRGKLEGIDKGISLVTNLVYGLIALIVAAIGIPQMIVAQRSKTESNEQDKINQELRAEIETLKKQRIQAE